MPAVPGQVTGKASVSGPPVARAGDHLPGRRGAHRMISFLFLVIVFAAAWLQALPLWVPGYYLAMSALTFAVYARDKGAARRRDARTPESTLHLLALLGGWPGARLAQQVIRHKSAKTSFLAVFWLTAALNAGMLAAVATPYGRSLLP